MVAAGIDGCQAAGGGRTAFPLVRHGPIPLDEVATQGYYFYMRCIGVKILKNRLSECLRLVAAGETVLVTNRDRVIAELCPPREGRSAVASDAVLADGIRKGWISPAALPPGRPPARLPVDRFQNILGELEADRAER